jgi:serine phosphatase RsbU (regulator of sigma subunit)
MQAMLQGRAALSPGELCRVAFAELAVFQGLARQCDDMTLLMAEM